MAPSRIFTTSLAEQPFLVLSSFAQVVTLGWKEKKRKEGKLLLGDGDGRRF